MTKRIAVIGCGHWGPNHIRNFMAMPGSTVSLAVDTSAERRRHVRERFPDVAVAEDVESALRDAEIDAVVVATPSATHYEIVARALEADKDVMCEKPLALDSGASDELVELARKRRRILMVGHVFVYNAGIRQLKAYVDSGECGEVLYLHSARTNLGPIRSDANVVWDLATHDVSIFNYLLGRMPTEVSATGQAFLREGVEDVAFITLRYDGVPVNIRTSWLDPRKTREIILVGDRKMLIWNDLDGARPIRIYDKGVIREPYYDSFDEFKLIAREGEVTTPELAMSEPLAVQSAEFLKAVETRRRPYSDGRFGAQVVRVLEAVQQSLRSGGTPVTLDGDTDVTGNSPMEEGAI